MTCESPEQMRARAEKKGYKNGTKYGSLVSQINYDPKFSGLLKTPSAMDAASENMQSKGISGTSGTLAQEMMSGYVQRRGFPAPLLPTPRAMEVVEDPQRFIERNADRHNSMPNLQSMAAFGLLPTPIERIYKGGTSAPRKDNGKLRTDQLDSLAKMGQLPTPSARDWKGKTNPGVVKKGSGCVYGETLPDTIDRVYSPKIDGVTFQLSPLFTQEMMGFPFGWTELPFLSQSGEPKPSKPTETQ